MLAGVGGGWLLALIVLVGCRWEAVLPPVGTAPSPTPTPGLVSAVLSTATPTPLPTATPTPPPTPSPTPLPPTPTPDPSLVPIAFTYQDGLIVLRHPLGWQVEDRSSGGEILLTLETPPGATSAARVLVNVFPLGGPIESGQLPSLADTYLRNLLGDLYDWVLPPEERWEGESLVVTVRTPVEDPLEQVHLELWFRVEGAALVVVVLQSAEAAWEALAPVGTALARSVQVDAQRMALLASPQPASVGVVEDVVLDGVSFYTATTGTLYALGEVVNTGETTYEDVLITLRLLGTDSEEVTSTTWPLEAPVLEPAERLPVLLIVGTPPPWNTYSASVAARPADDGYAARRHRNLQVENVRGDEPDLGAYRLVGEVVNGGDKAAVDVFVLAGVYDAGGRVVGVQRADVRPNTLEPGGRAPFEVWFPTLAGDVASYRLFVYGAWKE